MLQYYRYFFIGLLTVLVTLLGTNSSHLVFKKRYLYEGEHFKLSYYGLICSLALLLGSPFLVSCQFPIFYLTLVVILYVGSLYLLCAPCRDGGYHMISTYYLLLPFVGMMFNCSQIQAFTLFLTVALSFGRLACIFAGCCYGDRIPDDQVVEAKRTGWVIKYPDPQQLINLDAGVAESWAEPTVLIEAILQSLLTLGCLMFPDQANFIYGLGSIFILWFSQYRSKTGSSRRKTIREAIFGCIVFLSVCLWSGGLENKCYRLGPNVLEATNWTGFLPYIIGAISIFYGASNDVDIRVLVIYILVMATSYFWIKT